MKVEKITQLQNIDIPSLNSSASKEQKEQKNQNIEKPELESIKQWIKNMNVIIKRESYSNKGFEKMNFQRIWIDIKFTNDTFQEFCLFCQIMHDKCLKNENFKKDFIKFFLTFKNYNLLYEYKKVKTLIPKSFATKQNRFKNINLLVYFFIFLTFLIHESMHQIFISLIKENLKELFDYFSCLIKEYFSFIDDSFHDVTPNLIQKIDKIKTTMKSIQSSLEEKKCVAFKKRNDEKIYYHLTKKFYDSPGSIARISVFPSLFDFSKMNKINLRPLTTTSIFYNQLDYLETQFHFLRADMVFPLREGYLEYKKNPTKKISNNYFSIFRDVIAIGTFFFREFSGLVLRINCVDFQKKLRFSWDSTENFRNGSLVIFSKDNFQSCLKGIVRMTNFDQMNIDTRRYGFCDIHVEVVENNENPYKILESLKTQKMVLLESKIYFEAFVHTLNVLKEMKTFPFHPIILGRFPQKNKTPKFWSNSSQIENTKQIVQDFFMEQDKFDCNNMYKAFGVFNDKKYSNILKLSNSLEYKKAENKHKMHSFVKK